MLKSYIYNMAMHELLRKIEREEEHLKNNPQSQITLGILEKLHEEEKELHSLILEAEKSKEVI